MRGKICLVTGATHGIGFAAARALADQGAKLVIIGRNATKTAQSVESLRSLTGNQEITCLVGDLSRQSEVRRIAAEFRAAHQRLDVLLNNVGGVFGERLLTADGLEMTFALNHLSYFLLTQELLDLLKTSAPSRIVNVSSGAHRRGHIHFDDLQSSRRYSGIAAYCASKLANVMFTVELARRLDGTRVTVNCLHPGVVRTHFGAEHSTPIMRALIAIARPFMITPERGADTAAWLCSNPAVEGITGKYYIRRHRRPTHALATDVAACRRLWDISEKLTTQSGAAL